jgi:predicted nucleic acid-binding Zn ribbon protein
VNGANPGSNGQNAGGQGPADQGPAGGRSANRGAADQPAADQRRPANQPAAEEPATGRTPGRDLAHAALEAAKAKAKERGAPPNLRRGRINGGGSGQNPRRRRWSGSGADARDPQPLGRLVSRLVSDSGWQDTMTNARVFGQWARLVGEDVAEHAQPVALKDGELTVRASSTAWATQLRLLQGKLLAKIAAGVGHGVVKRMRIQGPTAPSWRKGPRHVPGRGPRDTYG